MSMEELWVRDSIAESMEGEDEMNPVLAGGDKVVQAFFGRNWLSMDRTGAEMRVRRQEINLKQWKGKEEELAVSSNDY